MYPRTPTRSNDHAATSGNASFLERLGTSQVRDPPVTHDVLTPVVHPALTGSVSAVRNAPHPDPNGLRVRALVVSDRQQDRKRKQSHDDAAPLRSLLGRRNGSRPNSTSMLRTSERDPAPTHDSGEIEGHAERHPSTHQQDRCAYAEVAHALAKRRRRN